MKGVSLSGHASAVRRQIGLPTSKVNLGTILRVGVLACAALIVSSSPAMGQAGKLDPTFATGGVFTSTAGEFNNMGTFGNVVAIQRDGKIVAGGQIGSASGVLRLHTNGALDSSFGTGGIVSINFPGSSSGQSQVIDVAIQTDGKIVAGISNANQDASPIFIVARLNANGSPDTTFGSGGVVETTVGPFGTAANVLALQPDGRILVAGAGAMVRYDTNGQLDDTFGSGGVAAIQLGSPTAIALQPDGKILLAAGGAALLISPPGVSLGLAGVIARYDANGSIDTSFGIEGLSASLAAASAVAVETSGGCVSTCKIVVAGSVTNNVSTSTSSFSGVFGLVRFTSNGSLDTTFGEGGGVTTSFTPAEPHATPYAVAVQTNGDIIVAGAAGQITNSFFIQPAAFALTRYTGSGALDTTFGSGGKVITAFGSNQASIYALALQSNGEIVAAGSSLENAVSPGAQTGGLVVARYLAH
jgi:uncharacterized delta-60 repeat protein